MVSRIVIDTSIFISSLIGSKGPSRELIRRCLLKEYQPLIGNVLFTEYESVRNRTEILERCILNEQEITTLLNAFLAVCEWINIYYLWRPNLRDEQDNHLIELAIAGNANYIVTNNLRDFQNTELSFPHLSIVKPDFLLRR